MHKRQYIIQDSQLRSSSKSIRRNWLAVLTKAAKVNIGHRIAQSYYITRAKAFTIQFRSL